MKIDITSIHRIDLSHSTGPEGGGGRVGAALPPAQPPPPPHLQLANWLLKGLSTIGNSKLTNCSDI